MDDETLSLRKMSFDGLTYEDDFLVIWRGLTIGRILRQSGVAYGQPQWWWGINFDQRPQTEALRGVGIDLADCQRKFKTAWARYRVNIDQADIDTFRRREAAADRRAR